VSNRVAVRDTNKQTNKDSTFMNKQIIPITEWIALEKTSQEITFVIGTEAKELYHWDTL
jgi:hypothetical protein